MWHSVQVRDTLDAFALVGLPGGRPTSCIFLPYRASMSASDISQNLVGVEGGTRIRRLCRKGSFSSVSLELSEPKRVSLGDIDNISYCFWPERACSKIF